MSAEGAGPGWDSLPPELLRRVVSVLLNDWAYFPPEKATDCLHPIRSVCSVWRAIIDADITQLALTVPSIRPACLAENFPNTTHLDLSRYHQHSQEVLSVLEHLKLKSLVLADPWQPHLHWPTQSMQHLTYLSFLADNMLTPDWVRQLCEALVKLDSLQELQLSRLVLTGTSAQLLATALAQLPKLNKLVLSGGAVPLHSPELATLLNVDMHQLHTLELMRLGVRMLPRTVSRLTSLTRLTFSGEMTRNVPLPDEVLQLTNLKVLDIGANLAEQLPGCVLQLTSLQELHAGMNRLGMQAHTFAQMEELETLVLASNKLLALHSSVWALTTLQRLDLGHNNLSDLPAEVSSLTGLTHLNVCHNFLTVLPVGLAYLTRLVELDVSLNTDMRELPVGLGALSLLTRLNASHMRLKQLPTDIGSMVSLAHLDVSHNSLHHLAPQLSSLVALTHLEASDNKLHQSTAVPEELVTLTALKVLCLARNRLQSLPEALGAFSALQVLDCSGNRLTSVPRVVGRCTALQQLLMSSNRLRGLTSGIGNLVRLHLLDLSHNQYRHLPTMTGDLTQLRELLLADNQLEDLPSSCSALHKVTNLTLHSNRLHVLPPAVSRMSGLQTLTLYDNPLLGREAVVLHLQRQLPGLAVDSHMPLQGMALPARTAEPSPYMLQPPYFTSLLSQARLGLQPALVASNPPPGFGLAPAGVYPAVMPHPGAAVGPGGYAPPYPAWAHTRVLGQEEVRRLEQDIAAHLQVGDGQPARQQQPAGHALPGSNSIGAVQGQMTSHQAQTAYQMQAQPISFIPEQQQHQIYQGHPAAVWGVSGGVPAFGPAMAAPAGRYAATADAANDAAGPPPGFSAGHMPGAAAAGAPSAAGAVPLFAQAAAEAAAGSSMVSDGGEAQDGSQPGGTPWASSGSQPGINLLQLLANPNPSDGSAASQPAQRWAAGTSQQWQQPGAAHPLPPGHQRSLARECELQRTEPWNLRLETFRQHTPTGMSMRRAGAPDIPVSREPAMGIGRWRQHAPAAEGVVRPPAHRLPDDATASAAAAAAFVAAVAARGAISQTGVGGAGPPVSDAAAPDAGQVQHAAAKSVPPADAAIMTGHDRQADGAQADDAMSTDSVHSSRAAAAAAPGAQAGAAAHQAAAVPGAAAAAGDADADETPSSAPDTECASDTSSDMADGTQTPAVVPEGGSFLADFRPAVQQAVRGSKASSSAGGSGSSSAGGAPVSKGGASSSGGGSSWGGSSGGGAGAAGGRGIQLKPSRLHPHEEQAAAVPVPYSAAGAAEAYDDPSAGGEADAGAAALGHAVSASEQQPGGGGQAPEGSSDRYFPFNVMSSAWWGTN